MKKFASEIFKHTISDKPYMEETTHIEGCMNPKIQEKYITNTKNSPVYYTDMLLPQKKIYWVKNK